MEELIKAENIQDIARMAPNAILKNQTSVQKCTEYGERLLNEVEQEGMTDSKDQDIQKYLTRVRETVKAMNDRRTPVTGLFDKIRSGFTALEKMIDVKNPETVIYRLQGLRNEYARKKLEEQEQKRKEQERIAAVELAKNNFRSYVNEGLTDLYNRYTDKQIEELNRLNSSLTLENYEEVSKKIKDFPRTFNVSVIENYIPPVARLLAPKVCASIVEEVEAEKIKQFTERYKFEMDDNVDNLVILLPSKKKELEAIEAQRRTNRKAAEKQALELRQREEAERLKAEEARKAEEDKQKMSIQTEKVQGSMNSLFDGAAAQVSAPVKAKVTKKIEVTNQAGFLNIFQMWWIGEGQYLSIPDLMKKFKTQIVFCEKRVNKDGEIVESPFIHYLDDVKAK